MTTIMVVVSSQVRGFSNSNTLQSPGMLPERADPASPQPQQLGLLEECWEGPGNGPARVILIPVVHAHSNHPGNLLKHSFRLDTSQVGPMLSFQQAPKGCHAPVLQVARVYF